MERVAFSAGRSGGSEDLEALAAWLIQEPELRGLVKPAPAVPDATELGAMSDVLVAAVGGGGTASVLAASLKAFFSQPRGAKVSLSVTRADGSRLEIDADRVARRSVPELTQQLLRSDADTAG